MTKQPAYLVIHKVAWYNDEFYQDLTDDSAIANPEALFTSREEAENHARHLTRQALKGADYHELMLEEEPSALIFDLADDAPDLDSSEVAPELFPLLTALTEGNPLPSTLTDAQADQIIELLELNLFQVLETELEPAQVQEAQNLLTQTPERPEVYPGFDVQGEMVFGDLDDPSVARLERITQLFGRHYATEELY